MAGWVPVAGAQPPAPGVADEADEADAPEELARDESPAADAPEPPVSEPAPPRPWAEGVSEEDQARALELFRQGNQRFAEREYAEAAHLYRRALEHWDHPAIHGNLSVSLIHLDEPIEAYAETRRALRFGAAPFEATTHHQLETNQRLLEDQLTTVVVVSDVLAAEVALDGEVLFTGAGRSERIVRAGSHRVVATKAGHLTFVTSVDALPGERAEVSVTLVPLEEAARYERRWGSWMPYATLAGGLVLLGSGVGLQLAAASNIEEYDSEVSELCPTGCTEQELPQAVRSLDDRGIAQNRAALVFLGAGGAVIGMGVILAVLNRLQRVDVDSQGEPLSVLPQAGPGGGGLLLRGSF